MIFDISYKTLIGSKPLCIRSNKADRFIRAYDGSRDLVLIGSEQYDAIYNSIRFIISHKSAITYVFSYVKIKNDLHGSLPQEKTLTLHNILSVIKSVFNKDQSHYYHYIFLEESSYKLTNK